MGARQVTVTVRNSAQPDKTWEGLFRVDTKAMNSVVPGRHLRAIGLQPRGKRSYASADGTEVQVDVAGAQVEFMGDLIYTTVIFGPDDAEPILGLTALESVGIEVDPQTQRLKRRPAIRLKQASKVGRERADGHLTDDGFVLDSEAESSLLAAIAEADRGAVISGEQLMDRLRG